MSERIQNVKQKEWNGIKFRSTLEADTAKNLDGMGIEYKYEERKIILQEAFYSPYQKDKVRYISYTPDFEVGNIIIECKGFETPEWKIKKKLLFKWLQENEPNTCFYQIKNSKKDLLNVLDKYWQVLGLAIEVTPKPSRKVQPVSKLYDSIEQATKELHIAYKPKTSIMKSLTGEKEYVYGYHWGLKKIKL